MAHSRIFIIPELLEHILHFLAIDKSLYPTLFVCRLWYRCSAPILWKRIELKGNNRRYGYNVKNRFRLEKFVKIICEKNKPAYASNVTCLEITCYPSVSDKKIKSIVDTFPNIIHLNFKNSIGFGDRSLFIIAESYPNLRYINLWDAKITDKG